jgi:tetratricopeptide (TPR) repeat protein
VQLAVLIAIAIAAGFVTLAIAHAVHARNVRDAAGWSRRARAALNAGRSEDAVEALRHAVALNRGEQTYLLSLGGALVRAGQPDAAERALLGARASAPENPDVNLALARLRAARGDTDAAVRYYRNALYAPWPSADGPRAVREELIRFLLARGEKGRALPEVLAATTDLPDTVDAHLRVARWFAATGEYRRALQQYTEALRLDDGLAAALAGAGLAAYELGDFAAAVRYLKQAPAEPGTRDTLQRAQLVLASDPLAPRLGAAERRRRLLAALHHVQQRLQACAPALPLTAETRAAADAVPRRPDVDDVTAGLQLVARAEAALRDRCGGAAESPLDAALRVMVRSHGQETG